MKNQELYNIYKNIKKINDPMYQYISYFLPYNNSYKHFLQLHQEAIKLLKDGFPFHKINPDFFYIIEKYCGREEELILDFFNNLYIVDDYDKFASFLSDMCYSYTFLKDESRLEEASPEFYNLFSSFTDILEMIASYACSKDKYYLAEITFSLLAIEWVDGTDNYDSVYVKIKDIMSCKESIEDFCTVYGIKLHFITTKSSVFIANEICDYAKKRRVCK